MPENEAEADMVLAYIQIGTEMVSLGALAWERIRALFQTNAAEDNETLARIDAAYAARIQRAEQNAAGGQ